MRTKLIFSTEKKETEQWIDLPFIPRINEWINLADILKEEDIVQIWLSAKCWSRIYGTILSVEYRHKDNGFYVEINVWCED